MSDHTGSRGLFGLRRNLIYATASSGSAVLLLAVLVLAGRVLGSEAFGRFSWALACATVGESSATDSIPMDATARAA